MTKTNINQEIQIYIPSKFDTTVDSNIIEHTVVKIIGRKHSNGTFGNYTEYFVVIDYCNYIIYRGHLQDCRLFIRGK